MQLSSNISFTENNVNMHIAKAWTAIDRLTTIKEKMGIMLVLLYGCTT